MIAAPDSPSGALVAQIIDLFARDLHVIVPSSEADLLQSGLLDSLGIVELLLRLEARFGVSLSLADLDVDDFRTVSSIAAVVAVRLPRSTEIPNASTHSSVRRG
jgi:D-alanine--poly(phosphoribitol) ligase subunit 2